MAGLFCFVDPGHPAGYSGAVSRSYRNWGCNSCIRLPTTTELTHRFRRVIDVNNSKRSRFPYLAKFITPSFSSGTTRVHAPLAHSKSVSQGPLAGLEAPILLKRPFHHRHGCFFLNADRRRYSMNFLTSMPHSFIL